MISTENTNKQVTILTDQVARTYQSYIKPQGLKASLAGLFNRQYKEIKALNPTDLKIHKGEVVGLVGANGAGKTTLLKILSGLIAPSFGSARVLDFDPSLRDPKMLKKITILLGQKNQLWWDLPAVDSFELLTNIYEIPKNEATKRVQELAGVLDCRHVLEVQLRRLSLGERMKMEIIGALLHQPDVIFLDEPTIGLDILAQKKIREFLQDYVVTHRPTVILTSHYMDDIALLADRLILLSHGGKVYDGSVSDFTSHQEDIVNTTIVVDGLTNETTRFGEKLINKGVSDFTISCSRSDLNQGLIELLTHSRIKNISTEAQDFEDVIHQFLQNESRVR